MSIARRMLSTVDRRGWRYSILAVLSLFPAVMVFLATRSGPGISPDSVVYSSAANAFASAGQLTNFFGKPLTIFPPGYPLLLGLAERAGLDLQTACIALNLACVAIGVLLTYALAVQLLDSRALGLLAAAVVAASVATVRVSSMMWTEPLFALLCLAVLNLVIRVVRRHQASWWEVLAIGAGVSGACALRYVGLTLIPVVAAGVFLALWGQSRRRAWITTTITVGLSLLGVLLVAMRNLSLGVAALGERYASGVSLTTVLHDSVATIGGYLLPESALPSSLQFIRLVLGLLCVAVLAYATYLAVSQAATALVLTAAFVGLYWLAIIFSEIAATLDPVNERLSAPVFAPMLVLGLFAARAFARELQHLQARTAPDPRRRTPLKVMAVGVAVAVVVCLCVSVDQSTSFIRRAAMHGLGFNEAASLDSPLTSSVLALAAGAVVATTNPWRVYWNTHRAPLRLIPVDDRMHTSTAQESFIKSVHDGEIQYLAYFKDDPTALTAQALHANGVTLVPVSVDSDGTLYRVSGAQHSAAP